MIFCRTLNLLEQELKATYQVSTTIQHRGEKGRQREHGLSMFLREMLPDAYGIASGEIVSCADQPPSPQCDIIIYDRLHFPILGRSRPVQQVPYESVCAVIECKSTLDTHALLDARRKFDTIRKLKRLPTKIAKGKSRGPYFVLFAYTNNVSEDQCRRFMKRYGTKKVSVSICMLDAGSWILVDKENVPVFIPAHETSSVLTFFLAAMLYCLRSIDLGNPNLLWLICGMIEERKR
jgi:hypothetical protein